MQVERLTTQNIVNIFITFMIKPQYVCFAKHFDQVLVRAITTINRSWVLNPSCRLGSFRISSKMLQKSSINYVEDLGNFI